MSSQPSDTPLVFIILVNWNGKNVTLECLRSLKGVSYANYRMVVVDNASTDGSAAAIRDAYPDVTVIEMSENLRFAGGTNAGIRNGLENGGELFLLLNNDTTVATDFLSTMVTRILTDRTIGMVSPKIYYHDDPTRVWFAGGAISMWTGTMKHLGIRKPDNDLYDTSRKIDYATGCCVLTKREVIERVGILDESFHIYSEDADWSERIRRAGYDIIYEPKAHVWHKLSGSVGGHLSWYKTKNKFVGNLRFFARYARWYHWLVFPWMNLLVNGLAAVRFLFTTRR